MFSLFLNQRKMAVSNKGTLKQAITVFIEHTFNDVIQITDLVY